MSRPKLEIASWIAGIIGAAVAGYAYFYPPSQSDTPTPRSAEIKTEKPSESKRSSSQYSKSEKTLDTTDSLVVVDKKNADLIEAVLIAKNIGASNARDSQLVAIVSHSLHRRELSVALAATMAIDAANVRDRSLSTLVCWFRVYKGISEAKKVAMAVGAANLRDSLLIALVQEASVSYGDSGTSECPS